MTNDVCVIKKKKNSMGNSSYVESITSIRQAVAEKMSLKVIKSEKSAKWGNNNNNNNNNNKWCQAQQIPPI